MHRSGSTVIKRWLRTTWGGKDLFDFHFPVTVHHWGKQALELSAGNWRQEVKQRPWGSPAYSSQYPVCECERHPSQYPVSFCSSLLSNRSMENRWPQSRLVGLPGPRLWPYKPLEASLSMCPLVVVRGTGAEHWGAGVSGDKHICAED